MAFHYPSRHAFHPPNFQGIVDALVECNATLSGVGTNSFTLDPSGYASNFAGVVKAIEDFNISVSGIQTGGGSVTRDFTAGEILSQGNVVFVSGTSVFKASALSGLAPENYAAIGITTTAATAGGNVTVNLDGEVTVNSGTVVTRNQLSPGIPYYLSKFSGEMTPFSTTSGTVTNSGTNQHQALVYLGKATTTTALEIEIQPPIILFE